MYLLLIVLQKLAVPNIFMSSIGLRPVYELLDVGESTLWIANTLQPEFAAELIPITFF